jgi:exonuclease III
MSLRVLTWNCRRASAKHALWQYFSELSPDIALLQEVSGLPEPVASTYDVRFATPPTRLGGRQRFHSAMLVRGTILEPVPLRSKIEWVDEELVRFAGGLPAYRIAIPGFPELRVVGVYSPAWPVARDRLIGKRLEGVKLPQNPDVWVSDLLVAALRSRERGATAGPEWIVAGDFNACETFDRWKGGPRGNREWLDRMAELGFFECLRIAQGTLTPTFRKPGAAVAGSQIDHLFVSSGLANRLRSCRTGDPERVFGGALSDHLPIIAEFGAAAAGDVR